MRRARIFCAALVAGLLVTSAANAEDASAFPSRPVRLIVSFPPGQATDVIARLFADELGRAWHQAVNVFNYPGGNSIPGTLAGRNAPADGYTITVATSSSMAVNPALYPNLPYDPLKDFTMVHAAFIVPIVVVAYPGTPYNSLKDLTEAARREPGKLTWGFGSTSMQLAAEYFKSQAGLDILGVPYKGSSPAVTDLLGGQIPLLLDTPTSVLPHIRAGKARALAVMSAKRIPQLPAVPTVEELGYAGFQASGWGGFAVPAATPPEIARKIARDVARLLEEPAMLQKIVAQGTVPDTRDSQPWTAFIGAEIRKWTEMARKANVKVE